MCIIRASGGTDAPIRSRQAEHTHVTLDAANLAFARELGLNVSAIGDAALAKAVNEAPARAWAKENADAIAERRAWIGAKGTPLSDLQVLKIG